MTETIRGKNEISTLNVEDACNYSIPSGGEFSASLWDQYSQGD